MRAGEERVRDLMAALEESVVAAKKARDAKVTRDLLSGGCSQFADVDAHPGLCCNCGNNPERCPTGVPDRLTP